MPHGSMNPSDGCQSAPEELIGLTAQHLRLLLREGQVSAREVTQAHLRQIDRVNQRINAICTTVGERALEYARLADKAYSAKEPLPPLHGLPIVHKDLLDTANIRTTYGSEAFRDHIPAKSALIVSRAQMAGANLIGKTNTPQFGTGGHTSNRLFGTTVNPWNVNRSAGGSSGGSAAALAAGMAPLATGTDMAGSLRIPAAFCNVVGFRPSPGRIPWLPTEMTWFPYVVSGPMARTVGDVAMLLAAVAGPDSHSAISIDGPMPELDSSLEVDVGKWRVAWAPSIAGLPVDTDVLEVLNGLLPALTTLDVDVIEREPDLTGADESFLAWRAWYYATQFGDLYRSKRDVLDESTARNIEEGLAITGLQLGHAEVLRSRLYQRLADFFETIDILLMPCAPVSAFPANNLVPSSVGGERMSSYLDWMRHLYYITSCGLPAISLPAGFTETGLPVGIQVVAGPRQDLKALQFARALEHATGRAVGLVAPLDAVQLRSDL